MKLNKVIVYLFLMGVVSICLGIIPINRSHNSDKTDVVQTPHSPVIHSAVEFNVTVNSADLFCPNDITVDAAPGECGAVVRFEDATAPQINTAGEVVMLFDGETVNSSPYIEKGMRLDGVGRSHIDAPSDVCENRQGALIHPTTSNVWSYNDGQSFTPTRVYVCSTNMRFSTGDCGTEFIPTSTGEVTFPDTPEWKNITSMIWEETGGNADTSIDLFRFVPSAIKQTEGLESGCFFPVGITPVTYTATDENGIVSTCTFNVTVRDVEKPALILKNFTTTLDENQLAEITIDDIAQFLPTDNCGVEKVELDKNIFTCSDIGKNTITVTVTDVNGNVTIKTVRVTISGNSSNHAIDSIDDVVACKIFKFPTITGKDLSGEQRFYTQANGMGKSFNEGDTIHFSDFPSYPVALYAFDSKSTEACKPQTAFQLIINQSIVFDVPVAVDVCDNFTFPVITGQNLSGNESYFTQPNGNGTEYKAGEDITRDDTLNYPITIYVYDNTASLDCSDEISFEVDLTVCALGSTIESSHSEICDNDLSTIILTALVNGIDPKGNLNYEWREEGAASILATSKTFSVLPTATTTYEVTIVDDGAKPFVNTTKATIEITVNEAPVVVASISEKICDTAKDGIGEEIVDLTNYNDKITMGTSNLEISYHANRLEADAGNNALPSLYRIELGSTVVFARVTDTSTGCYEITDFDIELKSFPVILLEPEYVFCRDSNLRQIPTILLSTGLEFADYDFTWSLDQGNGFEKLAMEEGSIQTMELGTYRVVAIDRETGCSSAFTTIVKSGDSPLNFDATADVSAFLNSHTINASLNIAPGIENAQFKVRLDDGLWFDMKAGIDGFTYRFENVETGNGIHQIYFMDTAGCWSGQVEVLLIGVPQFFTPNGDGFNEHWNIYGPSALLADSKIFIFDRYGKLLTQLQSASDGWDGTFNGEPLPSTDYWFTVDLPDGKNFKGHFAMKR